MRHLKCVPSRNEPSKPIRRNGESLPSTCAGHSSAVPLRTSPDSADPTPAQTNFFYATNAAAVEMVIDAIETQVERLPPDSEPSTNARNRVVEKFTANLTVFCARIASLPNRCAMHFARAHST